MKHRLRFALLCAFLSFPSLVAGAEAGKPRSVLIELDGSSSNDPEGDSLSYRWKQVKGPSVTLSDPAKAKPYFRADKPGLYLFELVVSDGKRHSDPALVEVMVERENLKPEARAPKDIVIEIGEEVFLSGKESRDADGDTLSYFWKQAGGPPLYLEKELLCEKELSFVPEKTGVYEFELVVSDGRLNSSPAKTRLTVKPKNKKPVARATAVGHAVLERPAEVKAATATDNAPIADIAGEQFYAMGDRVTLDGRGSSSPAKKALRYYWKQESGPFVREFDRSQDAILGFAPTEAGTYVFELVVSDGKNDSMPAVRKIKVSKTNARPIAVASAPRFASVNSLVKLDGSRSFDREGEKLEYQWKQVSGPRVMEYLVDKENGDITPSFRPTAVGNYCFELVVNDGSHDSDPAKVNIEVQQGNRPPSAKVAGSLALSPGETAVLQGGGVDPDGDRLSYLWRQLSGPKLLEGGAAQKSLEVTPVKEGDYEFELVVSDGRASSAPATCLLSVKTEPVEAAEILVLPDFPDIKIDEPELEPEVADNTEAAKKRFSLKSPLKFIQRPVKALAGRSENRPDSDDISAAAGPDIDWINE